MAKRRKSRATLAIACVAAVTLALLHIAALAQTFAARLRYPHDLEWMEGGQMVAAHRVMEGLPLYGDCSDGWISFAYPPVHAWALAAAGTLFGLDYPTGRALSVAAFAVCCYLLLREVAHVSRSLAMKGVLVTVALGITASTYPLVGAWYDVVRVDSVYMAALVAAAVTSLPRLPPRGGATRKPLGNQRIVLCALLMMCAVLAKQSAALFLPWLCLHAIWRDWRTGLKLTIAGMAFVGGSLLWISVATDWRFYTLVFEVMSRHPIVYTQGRAHVLETFVFAPWLVATFPLAAWLLIKKRIRSRSSFWFGVYINAIVVSFVTSAKVGAFNNNLMSLALTMGPVAAILVGEWLSSMPRRRARSLVAGVLLCASTCWTLWRTRYPAVIHRPTAADWKHARALNAWVANLGDVAFTSHPFLPIRNGSKAAQVHEQGYIDVMGAGGANYDVVDCFRGVRAKYLVLNSVSQPHFVVLTSLGYSNFSSVPPHARVLSGMYTVPTMLQMRVDDAPLYVPRHEVRMLFDFEGSDYAGWEIEGNAFGAGPSLSHNGYQTPIGGQSGLKCVSSFHPQLGDGAVGKLTSPPFVIDRTHLGFRIGGGANTKCEVALEVDGEVVRKGSHEGYSFELLAPRHWDVRDLRGREARFVITDFDRAGWGHVIVDAVELFDRDP